MWDLADRMRKALRVADVAVIDMADYLGVTRGTVSTWINGRIAPSRQTLRLWALRTGVPFEWLETGQLNDQTNEGYLERSPCPVYTLNNRRTGR